MRTLFGTLLLASTCGCLHFYHPQPLDAAKAKQTASPVQGLGVQVKAYLGRAEIAESFGGHLAQRRETIPVHVIVSNQGQETYRILRERMRLLDTRTGKSLVPETFDAMVADGTWGTGWQFIFSFILATGLPGFATTVHANAKIPPDYALKVFQDVRLEPGTDATGAVFFDPGAASLKRVTGDWRLVLEAEGMDTLRKVVVEMPLVDPKPG